MALTKEERNKRKKEYRIRKYNELKKKGLCTMCQSVSSIVGRTRCEACADKDSLEHKRKRDKIKQAIDKMEIARGHSINVSGNVPLEINCETVREHRNLIFAWNKSLAKQRRQDKINILREKRLKEKLFWRNQGLCYLCSDHNPVDKGKTLCKKCKNRHDKYNKRKGGVNAEK